MRPVVEACKQKLVDPEIQRTLHIAMHQEFTYEEFDKARWHLKKDKKPGPSGVTNNQMKSWNANKTAKIVFELSNIMWKHYAVQNSGKIG